MVESQILGSGRAEGLWSYIQSKKTKRPKVILKWNSKIYLIQIIKKKVDLNPLYQ